MTAWVDLVRSERDRFVDRLVDAGLLPSINDPYTLYTEIEIPAFGRSVDLVVTVPEAFPFVPPRVGPTSGDGASSWHRERDNTLCLWSAESEPSQPWTSPQALLERVREWFREDVNGWPDDPPNLDLERYWEPLGQDVLFLHDGLSGSHGYCFDVHPEWTSKTAKVYRVGRRWQPTMRPQRGHEKVLAIDIGELTTPPREFDHLLDRVQVLHGSAKANEVDRLVRSSVAWLLVRYERSSNPSLLALRVVDRDPVRLRYVAAAEDNERVRSLRRGPRSQSFANVRVAIVGAGAIGSFLADQLARSGILHLTLLDHDVLRPGNLPRHLVGGRYVGRPKVDAIAEHLRHAGLVEGETLDLRISRLDPLDAERLLTEHDLVIDATANSTITRALADAAQLTTRSLIAVCVQHDGAIIRVDRYPTSSGEQHDAPVPAPTDVEYGPSYEGGCGEPISPTPPYACIAAASLAASAALSIVCGADVPPTIIQRLHV